MFNFERLIKKYAKFPVYKIEETDGYRDPTQGGEWVDGEIIEKLIEKAAIVPLTKDELNYGEGGTYATEDKKLYCYDKIEKGSKIKHKDKFYTIQEDSDYEDFDLDLNIYFIKRGGRD